MMWTRSLIVAIFLAGFSAGLLLHGPQAIPRGEPEPREWKEPNNSDELDANSTAASYSFRAKRRILARVVTERCTVDEAAMFFAVLDEANPSFNRRAFLKTFSGQSNEERYRLQVTTWVRDWEAVKAKEELELKH